VVGSGIIAPERNNIARLEWAKVKLTKNNPALAQNLRGSQQFLV
jgi:hypothetical protein